MKHELAAAIVVSILIVFGAAARADTVPPASAPPSNLSGHGSAMDIQKPGSDPASASTRRAAPEAPLRPATPGAPVRLSQPQGVGAVPPPSDRAGHGSAMDIQKPGSDPAK